MSENKLLPCPFCGGNDVDYREDEDSADLVGCNGCGASTHSRYSIKEDARPLVAEAWNTRALNTLRAAAVQHGLVLVPKEPTKMMLWQGSKEMPPPRVGCMTATGNRRWRALQIYKAMLAAAEEKGS